MSSSTLGGTRISIRGSHSSTAWSPIRGWPTLAVNLRGLTTPANPHTVTASGYTNLEVWLHGYAAAVEGLLAPGAPVGLTVSSIGTSVVLSWSAPGNGGVPDTYVIEAGSTSGGADLANFSAGTTATTFSASNVRAGTYYVRVRADNAAGTSAPSNEVTFVVGDGGCTVALGSPSNLAVVSNAGGTVVLGWTAAGGNPT